MPASAVSPRACWPWIEVLKSCCSWGDRFTSCLYVGVPSGPVPVTWYVDEPYGVYWSIRFNAALLFAVWILDWVCACAVFTGSGAAGADGLPIYTALQYFLVFTPRIVDSSTP